MLKLSWLQHDQNHIKNQTAKSYFLIASFFCFILFICICFCKLKHSILGNPIFFIAQLYHKKLYNNPINVFTSRCILFIVLNTFTVQCTGSVNETYKCEKYWSLQQHQDFLSLSPSATYFKFYFSYCRDQKDAVAIILRYCIPRTLSIRPEIPIIASHWS